MVNLFFFEISYVDIRIFNVISSYDGSFYLNFDTVINFNLMHYHILYIIYFDFFGDSSQIGSKFLIKKYYF
jgi:hypothetical protein